MALRRLADNLSDVLGTLVEIESRARSIQSISPEQSAGGNRPSVSDADRRIVRELERVSRSVEGLRGDVRGDGGARVILGGGL